MKSKLAEGIFICNKHSNVGVFSYQQTTITLVCILFTNKLWPYMLTLFVICLNYWESSWKFVESIIGL